MRVIHFSKEAILLLVLFSLAPFLNLKAQSCISGWPYRVPVYVNNTLNGSTLHDFQVEIVINTQNLISGGKMRSDCGDIRFESKTGTALNYWIDSTTINSSNTVIWVKVNSISASATDSFYLYYGNPSATSTSSGASTFLLFDGFDSSALNTNLWSYCTTEPTESNGQLSFNLNSAPDESIITSINALAIPFVEEMYVASASNNYSFIGQVDTNISGYGLFYGRNGGNNEMQMDTIETADTSCAIATRQSGTKVAAGQVIGDWQFTWAATGDERISWPGGSFVRGDSIPAPTYAFIKLGIEDTTGNGYTSLTLNWVRARKFANHQPTTSLGTETGTTAIASASGNGQLCTGDSLNLSAGTVSNAAYSWSGPGYSSSRQNPVIKNVTSSKSGTYYLTITPNNGCASAPSSVNVVVSPTSVGGSVSGSVTVCSGLASGKLFLSGQTGKIVRWESSSNGLAPWATIVDSTDSLIYVDPITTAYYRAIVMSGNCSIDSSAIAFVKVSPTSVGGSISGSANVCSGSNSGLLTLSGYTGKIVRWEYSASGTGPWTNISNTTDTLSYSDLSSTTYYRAIIKSGACSDATSGTAVITVNPVSKGGNASGAATVCNGNNSGKLTLSGYRGNIISWQSSINGSSPWTTISDTTDSLVYKNVTVTRYYRALVQSGNCTSDTSSSVIITVNPLSVGGTIRGVATVCSGSNSGTLTLGGYTGGVLRWESSSAATGPWTSISNTTDSLNYTGLTSTTYYRAIVQSGVCSLDSSSVGSIKVNPVTVAGTLSGSANVCSGNNSGKLVLTGYTGSITSWESSTTGTSPWDVIADSRDSLKYTDLSSTTYFRAVVQSGNCAAATSNIDTITVSPVSVGGSISGSASVCSGSNSGTLTLSGYTGKVIKWESSVSGTGPWTNIPNTTDALSYTNLTSTIYCRAIVRSSPCSIDSSTNALIKVNPVTVSGTLGSSATVCYSSNSGTLKLKAYTGNVIRWESSATGASPWATIADSTDSLHYINLISTAWYRAIVQSGVCSADSSNAVKITVSPVSAGGSISGSTSVCSGSNSGTLTLSGYTGSILRWESSAIGTGSWTSIANTSDTLNYNNLTATTYYRAIVQSSPCSVDSSTNAWIKVNPITVSGTLGSSAAVCYGNNLGQLKLNGYTGNVIRWESSNTGSSPWATIADSTDSLSYINLLSTTWYRAIVQSGVCSADSSNSIEITVSPVTVGGYIVGATSVCSTVNSGLLTLIGNTGKIIKWQDSILTGTWTDITDTTNTYNYDGLTATTWFRAMVQSGVCSTQNSDTVRMVVNPLPIVNFGAAAVCLGQPTLFLDSSTVAFGSLANYAWDFGNGRSSVASSPVYTYPVAGTYNVSLKVTTNNGCIDSFGKSIIVNPMPTPGFTQNDVCFGDTMNFTNNSGISSGSVTYSWDFGDGIGKSTAKDTSYLYGSPGLYKVKLVVASVLSCKDSIVKTVNVFPRSKPDFSFNNTCKGNAVTFTNNTTITSGNISFLWNFGDSAKSTSANTNPTHLYAASGSYKVLLTVTSQNGCIDTLSKMVTVYPQPQAAFTFINVCYPDSTHFADSSKISSGSYTRHWDFGNGDTSSAVNPVYKFSTPGSYNVSLSITSNNGCMSMISHYAKIYSIPAAAFTASSVCDSDSVSFVNTTSMLYGSATYQWVFGDGDSSKLTSPIHLYYLAGTYNVTLIAYSNNGCPDTFRNTVTVYPKPVASFTVHNACFGFPVAITNNSSISSGKIVSYIWDFGDATSSTEANPAKQYSAPGKYKIILQTVSNNGCSQFTSNTVIVNPTPVVDFDVQNACYGYKVIFTNLTSVASGGLTYKWNFGDSATSTADTGTHVYTKPGFYIVKLYATSDSGCIDSMVKTVSIYSGPKPLPKRDTLVSKGIPFNLYASGGTIYKWTPPDSLSDPNLPNPVARVFTNTMFVVQVTNQYGCTVFDTEQVNVTDDYKLLANNVITPNGDGHNDFWKIINIDTYPDNTVYIFDRYGKEVFTERGYKNDWGGTYNGTVLPDGTYYYAIKFDGSGKNYTGYITLLTDKK